MNEDLIDNQSLIARIKQLEHERNELRKDIEQLCMQNAGPSYITVATRMHFQRTAGLEQEIEDLKKKLAACMGEHVNLQEELSEAYHIKSQLSDLHRAEVLKSTEAEKQLKFFQGCVAAAFAERDHSIMEAEKAKEKEEFVSQKLDSLQTRIEELSSVCLQEKELSATLRADLVKQEEENKIFKKVINKFFEIRQQSMEDSEDISWEDKCECLLHGSADMWTFSETSSSKYITTLEQEVEKLRKFVFNLENKLRMGLEIENHLKKRVYDLEKKKIHLAEEMKKGISSLNHNHSQHRLHIINLLDEGYSDLQSTVNVIEEKIRQLQTKGEITFLPSQGDMKLQENECRDVHINTDAGLDLIMEVNVSDLPNPSIVESGDASRALAQALQEKVAALLLFSQQEERYLLESNVNAALQKKLEEFQRNLLQVTNEKVKALMELAQLKQEHRQLQEKLNREMKQEKLLAGSGKSIVQDRDWRLKNLLKKTYLRNWINPLDSNANEAQAQRGYEENVSKKSSSYNMDFARMRIENAALKESLESMIHLISSVHRLRLSLITVKQSDASEGTVVSKAEALNNIITEAKLVKIALGSSLPVSWSAEPDEELVVGGESSTENVDCISAAGLEMAELLIFAAQLLMDDMN